MIAIVLIVGLVAVGSIGILVFTDLATENSQQTAEQERVEAAFKKLDSDVDSVARRDAGARQTDLALPDTADSAVREDAAGRIWINRTNFTTAKEEVLVNQSIGAIRYTTESGDTVGIQSGGVWRQSGNQTVMLSSPDFAYKFNGSEEEPTLTVPIVVTNGPERLEGGDISIVKNRSIAPTNNVSVFEGDLVELKVRSDWYVGWAQYFRQIADSSGVSVDHGNQTATLKLVVPVQRKRVISGLISGAVAEDVELDNNIGLNSFNSTVAPCHRCSGSGDTKLIAAGDVSLLGNVQVRGDVVAGDTIEFDHPNSEIDGNASYGDKLVDSSGSEVPPGSPTPHVTGWHNDNASVIDYDPVDNIIDSQARRAKNSNNNTANNHILGNSLSGPCTPCTLHSGTYFLESLTVNNERLVFDTTGGPINLVVNGTVTVGGGNGVRFDVIGSNRVNVYINSETPKTTDDLDWNQGDVDIPGDRTPQLWVFMDKNADATFSSGQTDFYGVVFGPGDGPNNGVNISFVNQVWLYGALVGKFEGASNHAEIVFDEALTNTDPLSSSVRVPRLTFLHVSVHEVCVQPTHNISDEC